MTNIILPCEHCGTKNRVPAKRLSQGPRCGKCNKGMRWGAPVAVDGATLEGLVREADVPLLVDFWAPWCAPCKMVAPVLEQVARARAGQVLVAKVNVDEEQQAGARHEVSGIPALVLFGGGQEQARVVGAQPKTVIDLAIDRHLARFIPGQARAT
jgi:thioredoxin 2